MDKLLDLLNEINDTIDYENENAIFDDALLDSLELLKLVSAMEDSFGVKMDMEDLVGDNFNSLDEMRKFINKK